MITLGINSVFHESSAALVIDGRLVAAAEEERFNRRKHGKPDRVDLPNVLPVQAIQFCLAHAGLTGADIDFVGYSFSPTVRRARFVVDPWSNNDGWGSESGERRFLKHLDAVPLAISAALDRPLPVNHLRWVPHHVAHAASAFYASGWEESAILVVDGIGEADTGLTGIGRGGHIIADRAIAYPNSLGFLWEKLCRFLGFSEYDACKVMGMAAYGRPERFAADFANFIQVEPNGNLECHEETIQFRSDDMTSLEPLLGRSRTPGDDLEQHHYDIAATLQECTNQAILGMAHRLRRDSNSRNLCFAGGVALNCTTNRQLLDAQLFDRLFIPSAPHDAGTAVGAAWLVAASNGEMAYGSVSDPYLGPEYEDAAIESALVAAGLRWERVQDIAARAASMLSQGAIVGWFQGRMEFGPRALGNRSLLADPRHYESRLRMNRLVKRRESFRPFAPSVLAERAAEWFDLGRVSPAHDLMLVACPARAAHRQEIPAVLHVDGSARLQLVRYESNPRYHELISEFCKITGVPVVLNTSFNDNEPLVCTPRDAVRTFVQSPIDALAIGNYWVVNPECRRIQERDRLEVAH